MTEFPVDLINSVGSFRHEVWYFNSNGEGVSSLSVRCCLRNTSNNYYFDFNEGTFKQTPTSKYKTCTAGVTAGLYYVDISLSIQFTEGTIYSVEIDPQNNSYPKLVEIYRFNSTIEKSMLIDGVTIGHIFELMMAMADGNYTIDSLTGEITWFKRNNMTPLTLVTATKTSRVRTEI